MSLPLAPVEVFCSFDEADTPFLQQLEDHLVVLQREGRITLWHKHQVTVGSNWQAQRDQHLNTAPLILLLISRAFLASDYLYGTEMQRAMQRHHAHEARVIPILLHPCDWQNTSLHTLQIFPRNKKAVSLWHNRDEAFADIVQEIRNALQDTQTAIAASPPIIWNVPYLRNPHFTGRDELLALLEHQLSPETTQKLTTSRQPARTLVKGLGGIGKTQLVVEYAYRARDLHRYTYTFWINAANAETLITSFVNLAQFLPSFPAKTETKQDKLVEAIKRWLEQCPQRWLLIFDNADDISVDDYLPQWGNGSIIITTRADAVGSAPNFIAMDTMSIIEGASLLLSRAQRFKNASDEATNQAIDITIALGYLPLALDQAGAYIDETGCSLVDYLAIYRSQHSKLLAQRGAATDYPHSVATTWSLSFQKIAQANPAAAELLHLCSFLAPDKIPATLVMYGAAHWPSHLQQAATDPDAFNQMIKGLLKFSLIKRLAEENMLSIHQLVQTVQRDMLAAKEQYQWAERVIKGVNAVFPKDINNVATWPECHLYLDQVQACSALLEQYDGLQLTEGMVELLNRTALYLDKHALGSIAELLYQQEADIREQHTKAALAEQAVTHNNRAEHYRKEGKYAKAEEFYQKALAIFEQVDPTHAYMASCLNNLALLAFTQEKYAEAEPLYIRALSIFERTLGENHIDTADCINNLANLYYAQGKYEDAELFYRRALAIWERLGSSEHPDMAISLNNLGELYRIQGKHQEAELCYRRALEISRKSLADTHPNIALILNNMALLYHSQGKDEEAASFFEQALKIFEPNLGDMHPNTADTLSNLARLYSLQGKYEKAEPLLLRAIAGYEHIWGVKHPYTQDLQRGYISLLRGLGRDAEARKLEENL